MNEAANRMVSAVSPFDQLESWGDFAMLALEHVTSGVLIHDFDGNLLYFNPAAADNYGKSPQALMSAGPWAFAERMSDEARQARLEMIRTEGELKFLSRQHHPQRGDIVLEVQTRYVESDRGPLIIALSSDVTERQRAQEDLEFMAFHDPLTGTDNRAMFDRKLEQAVRNAQESDVTFGVIYIDIDDFKLLNDEQGHVFGDQVLCSIAGRLMHSVREEDTVARFGGDEFVILVERVKNAENLEAITRKITSHLNEPIKIKGAEIAMDVSVGYALYDPRVDDAHSVVMHADYEMYRSKRRNAV